MEASIFAQLDALRKGSFKSCATTMANLFQWSEWPSVDTALEACPACDSSVVVLVIVFPCNEFDNMKLSRNVASASTLRSKRPVVDGTASIQTTEF
ncbi:MAG: hypothetical protein ISP54_04105 [Flavobacteriales bacterium]|nr:hypothetical protein [Flavobacteriales bacterium]